VYKPGFFLTVSEDGGKSFSGMFSTSEGFGGGNHGDHHALWIDPESADKCCSAPTVVCISRWIGARTGGFFQIFPCRSSTM